MPPVQPQPTGFSWSWEAGAGVVQQPNGQPRPVQMLKLHLYTITGQVELWMVVPDAERFLAQGQDKLVEARSGIQRATGLHLPPGVDPGRPGSPG